MDLLFVVYRLECTLKCTRRSSLVLSAVYASSVPAPVRLCQTLLYSFLTTSTNKWRWWWHSGGSTPRFFFPAWFEPATFLSIPRETPQYYPPFPRIPWDFRKVIPIQADAQDRTGHEHTARRYWRMVSAKLAMV